jgi:hypothetical protein
MPRRKKAASSRFVPQVFRDVVCDDPRRRASVIIAGGPGWDTVQPDVDTPPLAERPVPRWDEDLRALFLGEALVRRYNRGPATNQIDIIEAFQNAKWARAVDDPFADPKKLNQTISDLNKHLAPGTIKFHGDGTGERVIWEYET